MDGDSLPKPWRRTPLIESAPFSKAAGCRIFLKLDNLQPSGSFKSRGIGNVILSKVKAFQESKSDSTAKPHFYSSSGGNAGLACVTAASTLGYPATVVVPLSTKPYMIDLIRLEGASDVIQHGATWFEADTYLREEVLIKDPGGVYIHPFDNPVVWDGAATIVHEVQEQLGESPDAIICSVGGGGLFCGIMQGVRDVKGKSKVITVETDGAQSLYAAVKAGELVTLPGITSLATSLGATKVCQQAFDDARDERVSCLVVTDEEAVKACIRFTDEERMMVEPACGATLAVAYGTKLKEVMPDLSKDSKVVLIVCGGRNISTKMLHDWKEQYSGGGHAYNYA